MKVRIVVWGVLAATLVGCASTDSGYARQSRYQPVEFKNDVAYVKAVEGAARRAGVDVVWVHPPKVAVPAERN